MESVALLFLQKHSLTAHTVLHHPLPATLQGCRDLRGSTRGRGSSCSSSSRGLCSGGVWCQGLGHDNTSGRQHNRCTYKPDQTMWRIVSGRTCRKTPASEQHSWRRAQPQRTHRTVCQHATAVTQLIYMPQQPRRSAPGHLQCSQQHLRCGWWHCSRTTWPQVPAAHGEVSEHLIAAPQQPGSQPCA